jgi:hypothetical protein
VMIKKLFAGDNGEVFAQTVTKAKRLTEKV